MCNDYRLHVGAGTIADDFSNIKIKIRFPEGTPNIEPRDDIKITDTAPIVRTVDIAKRASLFSDGGAGRGRTAGRFIIFVRRIASSRLAAV
jgi:putative SOS response-associated peptidase YedK